MIYLASRNLFIDVSEKDFYVILMRKIHDNK